MAGIAWSQITSQASSIRWCTS